jgi:hypothetical protein
MYRRILVAGTAIVLMLSAAAGYAEEPSKVATFMRLKLTHSQRLLEGIALEDYKLIEKSAQQLSTLSRDEMWQIYQTPEYLQHSIEFRRAADAISASARKQNLDEAALSYVGMTLKCVECHKHVRDVRMAGRNDDASRLLGKR